MYSLQGEYTIKNVSPTGNDDCPKGLIFLVSGDPTKWKKFLFKVLTNK